MLKKEPKAGTYYNSIQRKEGSEIEPETVSLN